MSPVFSSIKDNFRLWLAGLAISVICLAVLGSNSIAGETQLLSNLGLPLVNTGLTSVVTSLVARPSAIPQTIQNLTVPVQTIQNLPSTAPSLQTLAPALTMPVPQANGMPLTAPSGPSSTLEQSRSANNVVPQIGGNELSNVSYVTQPSLPIYRADSPNHIAGLSVVPQATTASIGGSFAQAHVYPGHAADYKLQPAKGVLLRSGELLVSMHGVTGTTMVQTSSGARVYIKKSADVLVSSNNGVTRVQNLSGASKSVIVDPSPPGTPVAVGLGREILTAAAPLTTSDITPQDNVARRNTVVIGNGRMAVSEIYLPSALKNNSLLSGVLAATSSTEQLLGSALMKAAAVQILVRGVTGFAFSTVNTVTGTVLPRIVPPLPVTPPVTAPPPPATSPPVAGTPPEGTTAPPVLPVATLAEQASTAGQASLFPGDQTLQSIRNNLQPPPGSLPNLPPPAPPPPAGNASKATPNATERKTPPIVSAPLAVPTPVPTAPHRAETTAPAYPIAPGPGLNSTPPARRLLEPLGELPRVLGEEIKKHPDITAAILALIGSLLLMTTYFWRSARIRARQLAFVNSQLSAARDRALAASRAKSEFLANISHEIRTPITVVLGTSRMLMDMESGTEQRDLLQSLSYSAHSLMETVGGILDFSKIEAGKTSFEQVPFSPAAVLQEISASMSILAAEKSLLFSVDLDPSLAARVVGDPARLKQILVNLISNAIKFTSEGSIAIRASSAPREDDRITLKVSIQDTGVGISEFDRKKVFEPFVQADASTTRRFGGTGLGLSISKRLANLMGGDIDFTSTPGVGSEFFVTLPLGATGITQPAEKVVQAAGSITPAAAGKRVLVADDSPVLQKIVKAQLEKLGYQVDVVSDGQQAVAAAKSGRYALIFMDWQMPVMDGLEATRGIRSLGSEQGSVPIIAMTANAMEGDRTTCMQAGMSDYISKPFSTEQLKSLLDYWLT